MWNMCVSSLHCYDEKTHVNMCVNKSGAQRFTSCPSSESVIKRQLNSLESY